MAELATKTRPRAKHLVVCIDNEGYPASLEKRKIYIAIPDPDAEKHGLLRVVDESAKITSIRRPCSAPSPCRLL